MARLSRTELRLVSLILASAAAEKSVHVLQSYGATAALVAATAAAADGTGGGGAGKTATGALMLPRPMSIEALFALSELARYEMTHKIMMKGSLVTGLLTLQSVLGFQPGDNVEGAIIPRLVGLIICRLATPTAYRDQLLQENRLNALVAVLYTNFDEGATTELQMWALRTTGIDGSGTSSSVTWKARGGLAFSAEEILAARLLPCALRIISSAPDPSTRRFAMSILSVASEDPGLLNELAAFQESQVDYSTMNGEHSMPANVW